MKKYKYCKCCNTKHKPETDICPNCGAKLNENYILIGLVFL